MPSRNLAARAEIYRPPRSWGERPFGTSSTAVSYPEATADLILQAATLPTAA